MANYFNLAWDSFYTIPSTLGNAGTQWTYVAGSHTLEFGAEVEKSKVVNSQNFITEGLYTFNALLSGDNALDFLLSKPSQFMQNQPSYQSPELTLPAAYISDTWKVNRRLTLSLGVRWNPFVPIEDTTYHQAALFSYDWYYQGIKSKLYPNLPPGLLVQGDEGLPPKVIASHYGLFNPRVGLALDPFGDGRTSIRAGYGMYQDQMTRNTLNIGYSPFAITVTLPFPASLRDPYLGQYNPFPV
jgi:hypothetical protein